MFWLVKKAFILSYGCPHPVKIDLNEKLDPKEKTIQTFNVDAQRFRTTKIENPPTQEIGVASLPVQPDLPTMGRSAGTD